LERLIAVSLVVFAGRTDLDEESTAPPGRDEVPGRTLSNDHSTVKAVGRFLQLITQLIGSYVESPGRALDTLA
jgi:hypothetical protein